MNRTAVERVGERLGSATRDVLVALLATVPDAVYLVDPEGRVQFANPAALEMLGYAEDDLLGRVSHPTIHHSHWDGSHFPEDECPMLRPRTTGETVRVDGDCFWRKDGSKFRVAYSSAPLPMSGGVGAVVVFRDVTERLRTEEVARREAAERARNAELRASRARIVAAADAERRRLGRDLHDGAQQRLVRVLLALRLAAAQVTADDATQAHERLDAAALEVEEAIVELRDLVNGIHPSILTNRGLNAAIYSLVATLPMIVTCEVSDQRWPPELEAAAYFVVAEALTNVIKHADASEATVSVRERQGNLCIEIRDDGRGGASLGAGSGLRGLADRLDATDGTLSVYSPASAGTRVRAAIPLVS
ncbi:MAG TPA: PAS domain S-box protein [Solirubrobacteraceae bacterium]|jgi:PAS domain S-box-containing protein|nr:PAS domain S-box protein [Solirubrobacteraceae bacterium]